METWLIITACVGAAIGGLLLWGQWWRIKGLASRLAGSGTSSGAANPKPSASRQQKFADLEAICRWCETPKSVAAYNVLLDELFQLPTTAPQATPTAPGAATP